MDDKLEKNNVMKFHSEGGVAYVPDTCAWFVANSRGKRRGLSSLKTLIFHTKNGHKAKSVFNIIFHGHTHQLCDKQSKLRNETQTTIRVYVCRLMFTLVLSKLAYG